MLVLLFYTFFLNYKQGKHDLPYSYKYCINQVPMPLETTKSAYAPPFGGFFTVNLFPVLLPDYTLAEVTIRV